MFGWSYYIVGLIMKAKNFLYKGGKQIWNHKFAMIH